MIGNLAFMYHARGEYAEALAHYDRALRTSIRSRGPVHGSVANLYIDVGWLLRTTGHYAEAIGFLRRALDVSERLFGPDHPRLVLPLFNLGYAAPDLGDYAQARRYAERLVAIQQQQSGPEDPELQGLSDLALILALQGALDSAAVVARRLMRSPRISRVYRRPWASSATCAVSAQYAYDVAAVAAFRGDRNEAVGRLDSLVTAGYSDLYLIRDPKLLSLHGMPRFQSIVARVKRLHGIDRIEVPPLPEQSS